jgi:DNA endonuclease
MKRPQRELATRTQLYGAVIRHRAAGASYNQINRSVEEEFQVKLSKYHVSYWLRGSHFPDGSVRKFVPAPTAEVGYVIGVMLGDGSMSVCGDHDYKLKLRVTDKDFAEAFAETIAIVLDRPVPHVRYHAKTNAWHVDVASLLLQQFLRRPIVELATIIEKSEECKSGFLRGFFDSEGSAYGGYLTASNTDTDLIQLTLTFLHSFGIETTGPRLGTRGDRDVVIKGRSYHANKDCLVIRVRAESRRLFLDKVGFNIMRKKQNLLRALGLEKG